MTKIDLSDAPTILDIIEKTYINQDDEIVMIDYVIKILKRDNMTKLSNQLEMYLDNTYGGN